MQQDFFQHTSNFEEDRGERKVIGYKVRKGFKDTPKGLAAEDLAKWHEENDPDNKLQEVSEKGRPAKDKQTGRVEFDGKEWMRVSLFVRRVPEEKETDLSIKFREERDVSDALGNTRIEYTYKPEDRKAMRLEKIVWMWTDCENFHMTPLDAAAAKLFTEAMGKNVKKGESVCLDGKLTDALKMDLVGRFKEIQEWVMEAYLDFARRSKDKDDLLTKN